MDMKLSLKALFLLNAAGRWFIEETPLFFLDFPGNKTMQQVGVSIGSVNHNCRLNQLIY